MIASGSGLAMRLKLYVMAPSSTPSIFESIIFAEEALTSGNEANAIFPKSRLVNSMSPFSATLLYHSARYTAQSWRGGNREHDILKIHPFGGRLPVLFSSARALRW